MEEWAYEESEQQLRSGQIIVIGTDGVKEACNSHNEPFGTERLKAILRDYVQKPAKDIITEIFEALERFRFPAEKKDDETLVVIKVL
jgi:sigma-B regulation protein RsbU (phosphoserine phosphatase)